jgi:hypothetical protein
MVSAADFLDSAKAGQEASAFLFRRAVAVYVVLRFSSSDFFLDVLLVIITICGEGVGVNFVRKGNEGADLGQ